MGSKTSQQLYEEHLEKGTPIENLLKVMVNRADRYQNYYNSMKNRAEMCEKKYDDLLRNTGRLITTKVDHIAQDTWGSYVWYRHNKYRWNGKYWYKTDDEGPHYNARHYHGKFTVDILHSEEDMPEVFIGKCTGSVFGEKVITAKGHMIGYGDEFELRKITNV
ncbi:hypothetical protein KPP_12521 [Klebsiella phage KPP-1]|nr:hypothetical protein KPP_12521 [Klebsiella phage KPP-1]